MRTLSRLCFFLGHVLAVAFFSTFLILPMQSAYSRLGASEEFIEKYSLALSVLLLIAAGLAYLFSKYFKIQIHSLPVKNQVKERIIRESNITPLKTWSLVFLALVLLARVIGGIEFPFDNDEVSHAIAITKGESFGGFLGASTHPLSSYLSLLCTKIFGISMWSARLPAVLFCVAFLILFVQFLRKTISTVPAILIFAHLCSSSIFVWYFHSTRGYAPMILLCFLLFSTVYLCALHEEKMHLKKWIALSVSILLIPFTHGFATLFALLLPIALTLWIVINEKKLTNEHKNTLFKLNNTLLLFCPYLACFLTFMFYEMTKSKYMGIASSSPYAKETLDRALTMVMGTGHVFTMKIILLLTFLYTFILIQQKKLKQDFTFYVLATFLGFITLQRILFSSYVTGRFFLGILPLFVFWLSHILEGKLNKVTYSMVLFFLTVSLVVFPTYDGKPSLFQLPHDGYYYFLKSARAKLKNVPKSCIDFSYSGEEPSSTEAYLAEKYYFTDKKVSIPICETRYQLHFAWPWEGTGQPSEANRKVGTIDDLPKGKKYHVLHSDGEGRFLAEVRKN